MQVYKNSSNKQILASSKALAEKFAEQSEDYKNLSNITIPDPTPIGYNGCQLENIELPKFTINLDYLIINLSLVDQKPFSDVSESKLFTFQKQPYTTRIFKQVYHIYFNEYKFASLIFEPNSKIMRQDLAQLQLENHILYNFKPHEIYELISGFMDNYKMEFIGLNRLDVAMDFNPADNDFFNPVKFVDQVQNQKWIIGGREKKYNPYYNIYQGVATLTGFSLGARASEKILRCYNKTEELKRNTKNPKSYIPEFHKKNALTGDIWRFEYQLNSGFLRRIKGIDLKKILIPEYLLQLMQVSLQRHFQVHKNAEQKEVNKNPVVNLFNWRNLEKRIGGLKFGIEKIKRNRLDNPITSAKRLLKGQIKEYYINQDNTLALMNFLKVADSYRLESFWERKLDFWFKEFEKKSISTDFCFDTFQNDLITYSNLEI